MAMISESDLKFKHPFNMIVSGGTGSGKTQFIAKLIKEAPRIIDTNFEKIAYHYGIFNDKVLYFQTIGVDTQPGLPDPDVYFKSTNKPTFLILDDLLIESKEEFLKELFTRAGHHSNLSIAYLTQSLFSKELKIPRGNSQYFVFLRNPASQLQVRNFGLQIFPKSLKGFMSAYADAVKHLYGYLIVDMHPQSPSILRLRTDIFDTPIIYSI